MPFVKFKTTGFGGWHIIKIQRFPPYSRKRNITYEQYTDHVDTSNHSESAEYRQRHGNLANDTFGIKKQVNLVLQVQGKCTILLLPGNEYTLITI